MTPAPAGDDGTRPSPPGGEPGSVEATVRGRALLQALFAASRLGAMWGFENRLATDALASLASAVGAAASSCGGGAQRGIVLRFSNEMVYLLDHRLRVDFSGFLAYRHVQDRVARCGIGEIRIAANAPLRELVALLTTLESRPDLAPGVQADGAASGSATNGSVGVVTMEERFAASLVMLSAAGVQSISIGPVVATDEREGEIGPQNVDEAAARAYFRLIDEASRAAAADGSPRRADPRKAKRVVHDVIDVLGRDDRTLLALSQVKNYRGFAANHAANVCVLASALALRIGCHKRLAADIGVAAIVHEAIAPRAVPARSDTRGEVAASRSRRTARALLLELGFDDAGVRAVVAARDLHAGPARTGGSAPLTSRLIDVACFYDTMTTPGGAAWPARSPREALAALAADGGRRFDSVIVRALRGMLGPYPFGTVVELDDGGTAIVAGRNPHFEQPLRPVVRVLAAAGGGDGGVDGGADADADAAIVGGEQRAAGGDLGAGESSASAAAEAATVGAPGARVDLSRYDREGRRFERTITAARAPCVEFADPADYVLALGG